MLAQEPSHHDQILNVVLAVKVRKLLVEVGDGLAFASVSLHLLIVEVDLVCNGLHMLLVKVHSVSKALDGRLVTSELDTVQFDAALSCKAELLLGSCPINLGDSISTCASSHFQN